MGKLTYRGVNGKTKTPREAKDLSNYDKLFKEIAKLRKEITAMQKEIDELKKGKA